MLGCKDIYASFKKYIEYELLTGQNKYAAGKYGLQDAKKGCAFVSFPPVLHLQLKRFEFDPYRNALVKVNDRFEFTPTLELDSFLDESSPRSLPSTYELHAYCDFSPTSYFKRVLVHSGDVHGGHYYAFIRPNKSNRWYKMDDDTVTSASVKDVITENFGGTEASSPFSFSKKCSSACTFKKVLLLTL